MQRKPGLSRLRPFTQSRCCAKQEWSQSQSCGAASDTSAIGAYGPGMFKTRPLIVSLQLPLLLIAPVWDLRAGVERPDDYAVLQKLPRGSGHMVGRKEIA